MQPALALSRMKKNNQFKITKSICCLLSTLAVVFTAASVEAAQKLRASPSVGETTFELGTRNRLVRAVGSGEGVSGELTAEKNKISGVLKLNLDSLRTDVPERDRIMREKYLRTALYPQADLEFKSFDLPAGWSMQTPKVARSTFRAQLKLNGVSREVTGVYSILNEQLKTEAEFDIKLRDFDIPTPVYLGAVVGDFVHIKINIRKFEMVQAF